MLVSESGVRQRLREFDFKRLFIEELGWDNHPPTQLLQAEVEEEVYELEPIAEKRGMVALRASADSDGNIPEYSIRRKIERRATDFAHEHMIVYTDDAESEQVWQWVRREPDKPAVCREHRFNHEQSGEALIQKLDRISFDLNEEERLSIVEVSGRVQAAFDVERVTKKFYERFKNEHDAFLGFVEGVDERADREWYASIMLNRLMFVYFIQKKGFLDEDPDYLRNRLEMVREQRGEGEFLSFYRYFLLRLFHEGLGKSEDRRPPDLERLLGKIPYLNGGLFDLHELEQTYTDIQIPDEAFEKLFAFFDEYSWHLDERPLANDYEINPDVLGYIFEKYINQKQMGAYYTKEDITGYISQNTIIPYLFDEAEKSCAIAFVPGGSVWSLLAEDPDRYIYEAVRKGTEHQLPEHIAVGINDTSRRDNWNEPAAAEYALPTETWRECVERRERYFSLKEKLSSGEIVSVSDLITHNLDIRQFAQDTIERCEGPELLRAFYKALQEITVLDPTCGSGAFLFAALNVLQPLYEACLERMQKFVDEAVSEESYKDFRRTLQRVAEHPNRDYFIMKSAMVNNLYGVDIMEEAVEIARLRLFLKLVAQVETRGEVEPLPDIDFNLRAGNALVGFATLAEVQKALIEKMDFENSEEKIKAKASEADDAFQIFRWMQLEEGLDSKEIGEAKADLQEKLRTLNNELDKYLASEHSVEAHDTSTFEAWRESHQPFHWLAEFYGIMRDGGFNVIVGNPPYVEYSKVKKGYRVLGYKTEGCGNLYAFTCERTLEIMSAQGACGLIIPLSGFCTKRMEPLQKLYREDIEILYVSHFSGDRNPSELFDGVKNRLTIVLANRKNANTKTTYSSRYFKWYTRARSPLFSRVQYEDVDDLLLNTAIPKVGDRLGASIVRKIFDRRKPLSSYFSELGKASEILYHNAPIHWMRAFAFRPYFWNERDGHKLSEQMVVKRTLSDTHRNIIVAVMNSSTFFYFWLAYSDCYHLVSREVDNFRIDLDSMSESESMRLQRLTDELMKSYEDNSILKHATYKSTGNVKYQEIDPKKSKGIIDRIDSALAEHYGFTDEELDFIINYDIKFRMGTG